MQINDSMLRGRTLYRNLNLPPPLPQHHPDDVIEVHNLRLAESGSFVSLDDEVADVLEDKEVVSINYEGEGSIEEGEGSVGRLQPILSTICCVFGQLPWVPHDSQTTSLFSSRSKREYS